MVETQVGTDKKVISTHFSTLSHHVLSWYHADNCQAVKSMVDAPHYVRTVKRAKQSQKFNAGVLKKKWAGHGK